MKKRSRRLFAIILIAALIAAATGCGKKQTTASDSGGVTVNRSERSERKKETQAPETAVPETQAFETKAPETAAPETKTPETKAPETAAPETKAPETKAPVTQVPETKTPESQAPQPPKPAEDYQVPEGELLLFTLDIGVGEAAINPKDHVSTIEIEKTPLNEDTEWKWTILTCRADYTWVEVWKGDLSDELYYNAQFEGGFLPGVCSFRGRMMEGETLAIYTSLPWHTEVRVSAVCGTAYGEYGFGEENYLHITDDPDGTPAPTRYITGKVLERSPADYQNSREQRAFLDGLWTYRDMYTGEVKALFSFYTDDGQIAMITTEGTYMLDYRLVFTEENGASPDMMVMQTDDGTVLDLVGERIPGIEGVEPGFIIGEYAISPMSTDTQQLLLLTHSPGTSAALPYLIPDNNGEEGPEWFLLVKERGGYVPGNQSHYDDGFVGYVWRYDRDQEIVWVTDTELMESGGDAWFELTKNFTGDVYRVDLEEADRFFGGWPDPSHPCGYFLMFVDEFGKINEFMYPFDR